MDSYLIGIRGSAAVFVLVLLLEPLHCGLPTASSIAAQIPPAIIITEGKTSQGYPYLFGGVSSDERDAMEERAKGYNLKLVFAEKRGAFISGVTVVISTTKSAEITSQKTDGPWFYIQLPPGNYSVKATFKGETKQVNNLSVLKDKMVQQGLTWDLGEE